MDLTFATMNQTGLAEALAEPGAYARRAEERKRRAVFDKFTFDNPDRFVPFAGEVTGALGESATGLLKELASRVKTPPGEETDPRPRRAAPEAVEGAAPSIKTGRDYFKAKVFHEFLDRIVTSIARSNHFIARQYLVAVCDLQRRGCGPASSAT